MMKFYIAFLVTLLVAAFQGKAQFAVDQNTSYFPIQDEVNIEMISPNPVEKMCVVHLNQSITDDVVELRISNILGKTIQVFTLDAGAKSKQIDLEELPNGPYVISVYHNGSLKNSKRLFKQ